VVIGPAEDGYYLLGLKETILLFKTKLGTDTVLKRQ
jgi:glycosyltransferase A (GT-A) superfamily protein (DUF2064 family)